MKKRFLVAAQGMTEEHEKRFISWLNENKAGWWHWIGNFWLIVDRNSKLTAQQIISDKIDDIADVKRALAMEIEEDVDWHAVYQDEKMTSWLKQILWADLIDRDKRDCTRLRGQLLHHSASYERRCRPAILNMVEKG